MDKIKKFFQEMKTWQKYAIGGILFLIITVASFVYAMPDDYTTIYENLSETDKQKIIVEFSKRGVDYQIDETGLIISVRKQDVGWIRGEMNDIGLPSGDKKGYELFAESGIGSTQKDKELNELAGRKGQIENEIITNFSIVEKVTVNFVLPEKKSIFDDSEDEGTASVTITLRQGATITPEQITGIQYMVSSAIPGVDSKKVTVIDADTGIISSGEEGKQTLSTSYDKQLEIKKKTEQGIHDDIKRTLSSLLGYENVQINVNAAINFDEIVQNIEKYDDQGILRSNNKQKESTIKIDGELQTEAGLDANGNVPQYDVNSEDGKVRYQQEKENIIENFEIGKTVETIKKSPELTNMNVLVVVDRTVMEEKGITAEQLKEAIGIAAGMTYNPTTALFENGQVSVLEGVFNQPPEVEQPEEKVIEENFIKKNLMFILIGAFGIIAIMGLIIFFLFRKKKKKKETEEVNASLEPSKMSILTVGDSVEDEDEKNERSIKSETPKEKEKRMKIEKQRFETTEEVKKISAEYPKETADYIKKLMR